MFSEYVVMAGAIFAANAKDRACTSCYTYIALFDRIDGGLVFSLLLSTFDALEYFEM